MRAAVFLAGLAAAAAASASSSACTTALDCSLNGACVQSQCVCRPGWRGEACSALAIDSVDPQDGRNELAQGSSSWGGAPLYDTNSHRYYLYYARMMGENCTLNQWATNSACWAAMGNTPLGPFADVTQISPAFCHNPVPVKATDGTLLIYHIGCGNGVPVTCSAGGVTESPSSSPSSLPPSPLDDCPNSLGPRILASTGGMLGPWVPVNGGRPILNGTQAWDASITNVAPLFLPNGTVLLAYRGKDAQEVEKLGVASAPHWSGPYTSLVTAPIIDEAGEDPFPFTDPDGNFHILFHDFSATSGGHAFAQRWEGPWHYNGLAAYNKSVLWANGTVGTLSRRERPQLWVDPKSLQPLVLYTGVVPGPDAHSGACFTMAAQVNST